MGILYWTLLGSSFSESLLVEEGRKWEKVVTVRDLKVLDLTRSRFPPDSSVTGLLPRSATQQSGRRNGEDTLPVFEKVTQKITMR